MDSTPVLSITQFPAYSEGYVPRSVLNLTLECSILKIGSFKGLQRKNYLDDYLKTNVKYYLISQKHIIYSGICLNPRPDNTEFS